MAQSQDTPSSGTFHYKREEIFRTPDEVAFIGFELGRELWDNHQEGEGDFVARMARTIQLLVMRSGLTCPLCGELTGCEEPHPFCVEREQFIADLPSLVGYSEVTA